VLGRWQMGAEDGDDNQSNHDNPMAIIWATAATPPHTGLECRTGMCCRY